MKENKSGVSFIEVLLPHEKSNSVASEHVYAYAVSTLKQRELYKRTKLLIVRSL